MKDQLDNLHAGRLRRGGWFALPALALLLGTAGVVLVPARGLRDATQAITLARAAGGELERELSEAQAFEGGEGGQLLQRARELICSAFPPEPSEMQVHSLVALVAARREIELSGVLVGAEIEAGFPDLADRVMQRSLEVRGAGTLPAWKGLVEDLRGLGLPTTIKACTLARTSAASERFDGRMELAIQHLAPIPVKNTTESTEVP